MENYDDPSHYKVTTSAYPNSSDSESHSGGMNIIWIVLFFVALAAIVGLIIWIVVLSHRNTKGKVLEFKDANILVASNTSLTGSWPTSESGNIITLYATLNPPTFNSDGTVTNSSAKNAVAATGANTVTLTGLQSSLKYYATLVARNNDTTNYQVYTQIVYMDEQPVVGVIVSDNSVPPQISSVTNTFAIEDIIQVGKIQLVPSLNSGVDNPNIQFNQKPTESSSLWYLDASSRIRNNTDDYCLYSNNGVLSAKQCSDISTQDGTWSYNKGIYANQWCLTSTISSATPTCMVRGPISSSGIASVSVSATYSVGDAWANAYENK